MFTLWEKLNYRYAGKVKWTPDTDAQAFILNIVTFTQVKGDNGEWLTLDNTKEAKTVYADNTMRLDPATGLIDRDPEHETVGAYDYYGSITPERLGMTDITQPLFEYLATLVETAVVQNDLLHY